MNIESYEKIGFVDNAPPALNADNLNKMDEQIVKLTDAVNQLSIDGSRVHINYAIPSNMVDNVSFEKIEESSTSEGGVMGC